MPAPRPETSSSSRGSLQPRIRRATPPGWLPIVLAHLDEFLRDHAACERKASATALALLAHYPDRRKLADAMVELAREELDHFARVYRLLADRGIPLGPDRKSPYVKRLTAAFRKGTDAYFLDRLLAAAIMEARGCERFGILAAGLPPGDLQETYRDLAASEARHRTLYVRLAREYFDAEAVQRRLDELLDLEADIVQSLPIRPAVH